MRGSRPGRATQQTKRRFSCDLARRKLKICAKLGTSHQLFELISSLLGSASESDKRSSPYAFTREGPLTPDLLVVLLLFMVGDSNRRGYRHILDSFWDECASLGMPLPTEQPVTASAFCQARAKLSTDMLRDVLHESASRAERTFRGISRWHDRRVFAVDGCKMNLQRSDELDAHFGRPEGGHCPQATVSTLVNVSNRIPYDVTVGPYGACERQLLLDHLSVLRAGDVVVLDRGYPSHEVLRILLDNDIDFLVRVPGSSTFGAIETFRQSGGNDYRVLVAPSKDPRCGAEALELRAVRLCPPGGQESFFLSSLRRSEFTRAEIAELYRLRWQAEELYKLEKSSYFDQHQFHARSALGIKQEILAQAIYVAIARFLMAASAKHVDAPYHDLSIKSAVLALADYMTRLCLEDPVSAGRWLPRLLVRIARTRDNRRPGRSCPRRSFKPGPRWGPNGRRGA